jgi:CheY-like chemotaxis protein
MSAPADRRDAEKELPSDFRAWSSTPHKDLFRPTDIILDIGMPGLTGYEVARRLRQEPWGHAVLMVAMTGWGQAKDKELAREAGFDCHFTKPLDPSDLQRTIDGFFANRA